MLYVPVREKDKLITNNEIKDTLQETDIVRFVKPWRLAWLSQVKLGQGNGTYGGRTNTKNVVTWENRKKETQNAKKKDTGCSGEIYALEDSGRNTMNREMDRNYEGD